MLPQLKALLLWPAKAKAFCLVLAWLMVLVLVGTLSQKTLGLYQAQQLYFSSWVFWLGGLIPLPGGQTTLALLTYGLTLKLFRQSWNLPKLGTLLAHGSVLLLLVGGFVSSLTRQEGYLTLHPNQSSSTFSSYHQVELALLPVSATTPIATLSQAKLQPSTTVTLGPLTLTLEAFHRNAKLTQRSTPLDDPAARGARRFFNVSAAPPEIDDEANRAAMLVTVGQGASAEDLGKKVLLLQNTPIPQTVTVSGTVYELRLQPAQTTLPFRVQLSTFTKEYHPGTQLAKSYTSEVNVTDAAATWPATIRMNQPLHHRGYILYQSSFVEDEGGTASVLAVVKNQGRIFPYLSGGLLCLGLLIHLVQRLLAPPKTPSANPVTTKRKTKALVLLALLLPFTAHAETVQPGMAAFAQLPILHEGRLKPLDTFARAHLLQFSGADALPNASATRWLAEVIFNPQVAYQRPLFKLTNPELRDTLKLPPTEGKRYTFSQLLDALKPHATTIRALQQQPVKQLGANQQQLVTLATNVQTFFNLSRSLSLLLPYFVVPSESLAKQLSLSANQPFSYLEMLPRRSTLVALAEASAAKPTDTLTTEDTAIYALANTLRQLDADRSSTLLRIMPPQWEGATEWLSPWQQFENGQGSPQGAAYLQLWGTMAKAWLTGNAAGWNHSTAQALGAVQAQPLAHVNPAKLQLEVLFNTAQPFKISLALYLLALAVSVLHMLKPHRYFQTATIALLASGLSLHVAGIATRIILLTRPPVATLYESILFVGAISVILSLVVALKRRDTTFLLIAAFTGSLLHLIGLKYAAEGDTLGMLTAVLNTNFWLTTHVLTITVGYAVCVVASLLAHLQLIQQLRANSSTPQSLNPTLYLLTLLALAFTATGTFLGGIWADQSWGRFWGWDPKENGALFLTLWLIWLLHAKLSNVLTPRGFLLGMVLTNAVVACAWFGVNLLGVGLHSYGFTAGIATALAAFCLAEVIFALTCYLLLKRKTA